MKGISLEKALFLPANITRLERLARDKHASILGTFDNYSCKIFIILCLCFNVRKFFSLSMMKRSNKLEHLPMASLSSLV